MDRIRSSSLIQIVNRLTAELPVYFTFRSADHLQQIFEKYEQIVGGLPPEYEQLQQTVSEDRAVFDENILTARTSLSWKTARWHFVRAQSHTANCLAKLRQELSTEKLPTQHRASAYAATRIENKAG